MNTIKVNDRFEFYRDESAWTLIEWRNGQDKDGNPKSYKSITYYSSLLQICSAVIDRSAGEACNGIESVMDILGLLNALNVLKMTCMWQSAGVDENRRDRIWQIFHTHT